MPGPTPSSRRAEFPPARWHLPAYVALWAGQVAAIWALPALPTQDGASHVYYLRVLTDLLAGRGPWSAWYVPDLRLRPYLAVAAVGLPLSRVASPEAVERVLVTLYVVGLALTVPLLLRALGRPALPLAFVAVPLAFNYGLTMGFYGYLLAAVLAVASVAVLAGSRRRSTRHRAALTAALAVATWALHLVPVALVIGAAAAIELLDPESGPPRARVWRSLAVTGPAVVLLAAITWPATADVPPMPLVWHAAVVRLFLLVTMGIVSLGPRQVPVALALAAWIALCLPWGPVRDGAGRLPWRRRGVGPAALDDRLKAPARDGAAALADRLALALGGAAALVVVAAPNAALSGAYMNERAAFLAPLLVLPALRPPRRTALARRPEVHAAFLALLAAASLTASTWYAARAARPIVQLRAGLAAPLEPGGTVLVARFAPRPLWPLADPLLHAAGWYGRAGLVDVGYDQESVRYFPVRFRPGRGGAADYDRVYNDPRSVDWSAEPDVDYLLAMGAGEADRAALGAGFDLVWSAPDGPLSIWGRR